MELGLTHSHNIWCRCCKVIKNCKMPCFKAGYFRLRNTMGKPNERRARSELWKHEATTFFLVCLCGEGNKNWDNWQSAQSRDVTCRRILRYCGLRPNTELGPTAKVVAALALGSHQLRRCVALVSSEDTPDAMRGSSCSQLSNTRVSPPSHLASLCPVSLSAASPGTVRIVPSVSQALTEAKFPPLSCALCAAGLVCVRTAGEYVIDAVTVTAAGRTGTDAIAPLPPPPGQISCLGEAC